MTCKKSLHQIYLENQQVLSAALCTAANQSAKEMGKRFNKVYYKSVKHLEETVND